MANSVFSITSSLRACSFSTIAACSSFATISEQWTIASTAKSRKIVLKKLMMCVVERAVCFALVLTFMCFDVRDDEKRDEFEKYPGEDFGSPYIQAFERMLMEIGPIYIELFCL